VLQCSSIVVTGVRAGGDRDTEVAGTSPE